MVMVPTTELDRAATERLASHDLRYTSGRRMIVSVLRKADGPVTLPELLELAGDVPQSSAYRNLSVMEEAGIVRRLVHGGDHAHFELAEELTEHHHHLICEACGSVQDFTLDAGLETALDETFSRIASSAGATVTGHTVDLFVTCSDCS
ncbi:MAG: Fur family transcriptional regulator [Ilumatobacter sp.]